MEEPQITTLTDRGVNPGVPRRPLDPPVNSHSAECYRTQIRFSSLCDTWQYVCIQGGPRSKPAYFVYCQPTVIIFAAQQLEDIIASPPKMIC